MKKRLVLIILSVIMLGAGCGRSESESILDKQEESVPSTSTIQDIPVTATQQVPYWAREMRTEGNLYQHLNLDGIGDADDAAYVSIFQFGDYEEKVIVIQVHLGTGETMAKIFPVYGAYSFQTGKLFSKDKDAIILGVRNPTSNYNATDTFILDIYPVEADPVPYIVTRLDTTVTPNILFFGNPTLDAGNTYVTGYAEVVDIDGAPLQGLEVPVFDYSTGQYQELKKILYWKDGEWLLSGD